ncbi:MAG: hypothetical protein J6R30_06900 [Bacteroidales bacterium]|nr:hypothetical protein [Bacteroidales bacterium]
MNHLKKRLICVLAVLSVAFRQSAFQHPVSLFPRHPAQPPLPVLPDPLGKPVPEALM